MELSLVEARIKSTGWALRLYGWLLAIFGVFAAGFLVLFLVKPSPTVEASTLYFLAGCAIALFGLAWLLFWEGKKYYKPLPLETHKKNLKRLIIVCWTVFIVTLGGGWLLWLVLYYAHRAVSGINKYTSVQG